MIDWYAFCVLVSCVIVVGSMRMTVINEVGLVYECCNCVDLLWVVGGRWLVDRFLVDCGLLFIVVVMMVIRVLDWPVVRFGLLILSVSFVVVMRTLGVAVVPVIVVMVVIVRLVVVFVGVIFFMLDVFVRVVSWPDGGQRAWPWSLIVVLLNFVVVVMDRCTVSLFVIMVASVNVSIEDVCAVI